MQQDQFPPNTVHFRDIEGLPQVQAGAYNQPKSFSETDEEPYRHVRHWAILRFQNRRWYRLPLNPNEFQWDNAADLLVGTLVSSADAATDIPIQVPFDSIQLCMDREKLYRGYWFHARNDRRAWYRLCEPLGTGFIHHIARAVLGMVSLVVDTPMRTGETVQQWLQRHRIHSFERDLTIISYLRQPIKKHLLGAKDDNLLDTNSLFLESLSKLKFPDDLPTNQQLDDWSTLIEKQLNQEPWGEAI